MWPHAWARPKAWWHASKVAGARHPCEQFSALPAPWARVLCLQFGLPIGLVVAMFLVSYALVVAGPLKGISGAVTPAGGVDPHANVLDEGEYDEL